MLFERQDYQEECVYNIIQILKNYCFESHKYKYLEEGLRNFYKNKNIPAKNLPKLESLNSI